MQQKNAKSTAQSPPSKIVGAKQFNQIDYSLFKTNDFEKPRSFRPPKLKIDNLNLFDAQNLQIPRKHTQTVVNHTTGRFSSLFNSSASASSHVSGLNSPTMTQLSYATSVQNYETKAIFEERLYQLQNALRMMQNQPHEGQCKEFENIIRQVKQIKSTQESNDEPDIIAQKMQADLKSLKIWVRVILEAPLAHLINEPVYGFELVKIILEKLWQDCIESNQRIVDHQSFLLKRQQALMQQRQMQMTKNQQMFNESAINAIRNSISSQSQQQQMVPLSQINDNLSQFETQSLAARSLSPSKLSKPTYSQNIQNLDFQRQCQSFSKFFHLTFELFPLRMSIIQKVVQMIFSQAGIFSCIENAYVKAPVTIQDILACRAKSFLPNSEEIILKAQVFQNMTKAEEVTKKAKEIMEKYKSMMNQRHKNSMEQQNSEKFSDSGSKHSFYQKENKNIEMTDKLDKIFMLTLITFHQNDKITPQKILENQKNVKLYIGYTQHSKQPDLFLKLISGGPVKPELKQEDAVSIKKCMAGLIDHFKTQIEEQVNLIYDNTIIRKLPTYLKKIAQSYPACQKEILENLSKNFPHKDRPQIVSLLVYMKFALKVASMLNTTMCTDAESEIYKLITENIANLDVDIKIRLRKGTHLIKTYNQNATNEKTVALKQIHQKIESKEQYSKSMVFRYQDEKEIKVELMLIFFMRNIEEKINAMNKGGKRSIQKFSEFFMNLCCEKILNVSQSNFIQYIPLYIILKAKRHFDAVDLKKTVLDKSSSCEVLFTTCFISELIQRSFPAAFMKKGQRNPQNKYLCLESRMRSWNFLSSLLSQREILDESILIKSITLIIDNFEKSNQSYQQNNRLQGFYNEIENPGQTADTTGQCSQTSIDANGDRDVVMQHYTKQFHHCFVQGMLQILTTQHLVLKNFEQPDFATKQHKTLLQKIIRIIFKQGQTTGGLQLCSQTILCDFLAEFESNSDMTSYIFKDKQNTVQRILQTQTNDLSNSIKLQFFQKIQRFMPYDNFEQLHMKKLSQQLKSAISLPEKTVIFDRSPSFVLSIPDDKFVAPDQIIQTHQEGLKKFSITSVSNSITVETLQQLQSQRQNKFGKSAAEKNHLEDSQQVSECDTFMSVPNIDDPEYEEKFKKIKQINKCQKMKTQDLREMNQKYK